MDLPFRRAGLSQNIQQLGHRVELFPPAQFLYDPFNLFDTFRSRVDIDVDSVQSEVLGVHPGQRVRTLSLDFLLQCIYYPSLIRFLDHEWNVFATKDADYVEAVEAKFTACHVLTP